MLVHDLGGLRQALETVSAQKVGMGPTGFPVASALNKPGKSCWQRFGVPPPLVAALDELFEGLPWQEARETVLRLPAAVARSGRDLRPVTWRFLAAELRVMADQHIGNLPTAVFVRKLATLVEHGLAGAIEGVPWTEGFYVHDQLPRQIPPKAGRTATELLASLDFDVHQALRQVVKARFNADTAIVGAVRLTAGARGQPRIRTAVAKTIEEVCNAVREFQRAIIGTGAFAAALAAPEEMDRAAVMALARLTGYRRQAASLLHLIRSE